MNKNSFQNWNLFAQFFEFDLNLFFLIISIDKNTSVSSKQVCQTRCIEFLDCVNNYRNLGYTKGICNDGLCCCSK